MATQRPEMRPAPDRADDPRAAAAARAAAIREHLGAGGLDEGPDDFKFDRSIIPDGWDYEWKTLTVYGAENPAYQVALARTGWEPVPASRHPEFMPAGSTEKTIIRKGQILMERPLELTEESRRIELRKARAQVRQKEEQLTAAPPGQFEREDKNGSLVKVRKSYEAIPIPVE